MNGDTIYHVRYGGNADYYFGSIAAIYDVFTSSVLGVTLEQLWRFGITERRPFRNGSCVISKGRIHRKKGQRKREKTPFRHAKFVNK